MVLQKENEVEYATNTAWIADQYFQIMRPIVHESRLALEFKSPPERIFDYTIYDVLTSLAKHHRLHRKVKHSQAGMQVHFNTNRFQSHDLLGPFPKLYIQGGYQYDPTKRMAIVTLFLLIFCIICIRF